MLPLTVLFSLVAASAAQNYSFPKGFDVESVELATRSSWCTAQRSTCPKICNGKTDENSCEPESLTFSCKCDNGTVDVEPYKLTVPFFVCQANFGNCIAGHPDDADGQDQCKKDNKCGTLNATETASKSDSESSSSASESSSPSSSSTATLTTHQSDNSDSAAASSSPSTTANAAAALRMVQEQSTGVFATALLVVMGLAL
ncbi:uncharacterized protein EURHEDRAFT_414488 [Aspergillus ruber CBS 135680]|uniref:DUF7707 domain-containing protein n=1 Tax=Aspergillus ruber (strain CBS 135680) TaxID=1388766 RepID=A0A017S9G6_ASPRC|nr:uncharacterized protein EURHEDRAFT_414488 [Aspergillus ruber CBS 135680]EYE93284.1 hypothetical protein EURHEDRAFT_414488 [Aspergillus ruber CBS 135680]